MKELCKQLFISLMALTLLCASTVLLIVRIPVFTVLWVIYYLFVMVITIYYHHSKGPEMANIYHKAHAHGWWKWVS